MQVLTRFSSSRRGACPSYRLRLREASGFPPASRAVNAAMTYAAPAGHPIAAKWCAALPVGFEHVIVNVDNADQPGKLNVFGQVISALG